MKIRVVIDAENPDDVRAYNDATGVEINLLEVHVSFESSRPKVSARWQEATLIPGSSGRIGLTRFGEEQETHT